MTSKVVDLINGSPEGVRPTVLVSATAVGYYGSSETQVFDERSPSGNDYLAEVCREWEATALKANKDVRLALIRIGVVLGKDGGALGIQSSKCFYLHFMLTFRCIASFLIYNLSSSIVGSSYI